MASRVHLVGNGFRCKVRRAAARRPHVRRRASVAANGEPITCSEGLTATVTATGPNALRVATKGTAITDTGVHFDADLKRE